MAVDRRNMWEWINILYMYLYVRVAGFSKKKLSRQYVELGHFCVLLCRLKFPMQNLVHRFFDATLHYNWYDVIKRLINIYYSPVK